MKSGRFFLPLVLIGLVVMVTPVLFPGKPRIPPPIVAGTVQDSVGRAAAPAASPVAGAARAPVEAPTGAVAPRAVPAETTVVATPRVRYRFSNLGASLIGAEMVDYRVLGADSQRVELARTGDAPLIQFRLRAGPDTASFAGATFRRESAAQPLDATFRGVVRDMPVSVRWDFASDTHTVTIDGERQPVGFVGRVTVRVDAAQPGTYLLVDLPSGFRTSEADSSSDYQHLAFAYKPPGGAGLVRFSSLDPGEPDLRPGPLTWAVAKSKYFLVGLLAPDSSHLFAELQAMGLPRTSRDVTSARATVIVPLRDGSATFETYVGPQEWRRLVAMGREFETANPYGGFMQGMVQPFATIVMRVLLWMKDVLELNYGLTLIIFGVLIRIVLWPLNQVALRSSMKMQRIQPELAAIQKKYASNREKLSEEMMRVYKAHGMSPFSALSGCLPMLIPMPVLFALFFVFQNTIEFRGVGFWWMTDISQKDPYFILPVAMGLSMFALSWIGMRNLPPSPQSKIMLYFLPVMMTVLLFNFAAGLNLYYAAQNLAALPQQWLIANERAKVPAKTG